MIRSAESANVFAIAAISPTADQLETVLDGGLDAFLDGLETHYQAERLKEEAKV